MERSRQQRAAGATQTKSGVAPRPAAPDAKPPDLVDEAGMDSFPASDPPAHWAGKDRPPLLNGEEVGEDDTEAARDKREDKDDH